MAAAVKKAPPKRAANPKATATPAVSGSSAADQATNFGWSLAVINSNPELKALFTRATAAGAGGGWTPEHFVAKVRDTKWFKTHADTARQAIILQKADPATYSARVAQSAAQANAMAGTSGASMSAAQVNQIAVDTVMFGWNPDQLRQHMVKYVRANAGGQYSGGAATFQHQYTELSGQYGIAVSPQTMGAWVRDSIMGRSNTDKVRNYMVQQASSRYPSLAERLKAGETVDQIADPYRQSYAKILEVNPNTVKLDDNLLQSALSGKDDKGKPSTKSVWQFEQDLRQDPRFMKTQQAQDQGMSMAHKVLNDWGIVS